MAKNVRKKSSIGKPRRNEKSGLRKNAKLASQVVPAGPHTPVTNVTTEAIPARENMLSESAVGQARGVAEPRGEVEAISPAIRTEFAVASLEAPDTKGLADIGAVSFTDPGIVLETVHGADNRIQVTETDKYPWRVNASLLITARDGSQWIGTGWFISPRTLITAGHCVYIKHSGSPTRDGWVKSIVVMPGRNGGKLPYGSATSTRFWTVKGWADTGDENYDYAAIIISNPLGEAVGNMGFAVFGDAELKSMTASVVGYPGDKPSGTLWYDTKQIASTSASKVYYDIDTAGGQSGAAVYVIKNDQRIAIAVHAYGGATTNSGTRISPPLFNNLMNWKE